ncbi:MAG: hypothetical protein AABY34_03065 [Pseudomonadota bacterium]
MPRFGELPQPQHSMPVEAAGRAAVWRMRVASAGAVTEVRTPEEIGEWRKAEAEEKKRRAEKKRAVAASRPPADARQEILELMFGAGSPFMALPPDQSARNPAPPPATPSKKPSAPQAAQPAQAAEAAGEVVTCHMQ